MFLHFYFFTIELITIILNAYYVIKSMIFELVSFKIYLLDPMKTVFQIHEVTS